MGLLERIRPKAGFVSKILLNKYLFASLVFVVWVAFFDRNALVTQWHLNRTINKLEDEKAFLIKETEASRVLQQDIMANKEKYAREKYYMKKPGEQIFIIEE